jgi:hypothetical protein
MHFGDRREIKCGQSTGVPVVKCRPGSVASAALMAVVSCTCAAALVRAAGAQVRMAPGAQIGEQVVVRLYVVLADSNAYVPLVREDLDVRGTPDSLTLTTNDAGGATVLLAPGPHQAVAIQAVWWRGHRLTWRVPFDVHPGMGDVLLTLQNATVLDAPSRLTASRISSVAGGTVVSGEPPPPPAKAVRVKRGPKVVIDVEGTDWEVFAEQLGGLAPAPGGRRGDAMFALLFHRDGHTRQLDDFPSDWRDLPDSDLVALFARARVIEP